MPFKQFDKDFSWPKEELAILELWDKEDTFRDTLRKGQGRPHFIFYEGPPTANGRPGIHHVIARTIKDTVCRYKTMRGYLVERKGGWDTHGLPVEIEVEKKLGLKNKQEVVSYGVGRFNEECRVSVFKYLEDWNRITRRTAFWIDLDNAYVTLHNNYIESVWWILKDFYDRGLIYQGHKILPFCPRCGTGLSSHEVAQGYEEVADPSAFVKMRAKDGNYSFLVWTTTPWTLPSNVALAVNPTAIYVTVQFGEEKLLLADALLGKAFGTEPYTILEKCNGASLAGRKYIPLFPFFPDLAAPAYSVVTADFVTLDDGTGIVHIAPGFGADDYEVGQKHGLPVVQAIEQDGTYKSLAGKYAGMWIKDADLEILKDLKIAGQLFKKEKYVHNYPFCWRCHSPLIYIARQSWYIRTTAFRDQLIANSNATRWKPDDIRTGRMLNWLENNIDWAISRERFWGTPLPLWVCQDEKCGAIRAVGSIAQLQKEAINPPALESIDLHKPQMDEVRLRCACGAEMKRVSEVLDVWFDSGAMPYAQWHYPFENKELVEKTTFPADFISEGIDQTRGWFYSLLAIATILKAGHPELGSSATGEAFRSVLVTEFILDKAGKKMSKHKGNVVDPFTMVDKYGSDPLRWYMLTVSNPWLPTRFDEDGLVEVLRKFFDTLKNCYNFFALYANIDQLTERATKAGLSRREFLAQNAAAPDRLDRWVVSRYNSLVMEVVEDLDDLEITRAMRKISDFTIDELSNWYVRRNRKRFWRSGDDRDKLRAYLTMYDILLGVSKLIAPTAPLVAETLYRQLEDESIRANFPSVHMCGFPTPDESAIDKACEADMAVVEKVVSLGRAARTRVNLKIRQPLAEISVATPAGANWNALIEDKVEILGELNIKALTKLVNPEEYQSYSAKLNFATAGKKYGAIVKDLGGAVAELDSAALKNTERTGKITVRVAGQEMTLPLEDILLTKTDRPGYAVESHGGVTIAVVTTLTPELVSEGFARETVNRIQNMRKQADFAVTDRITIFVSSGDTLTSALGAHRDLLRQETLADEIVFNDTGVGAESSSTGVELTLDQDINGEKARITVVRR